MESGNRKWSTVRRKFGGNQNCLPLSEKVEPEFCVNVIQKPSVQNYSWLKHKLEEASKEWIVGFLELGGMDVLLQSLERLGSRSQLGLAQTVIQLECTCCIKSLMNSSAGLSFMVANAEFTRQLGRGLLIIMDIFYVCVFLSCKYKNKILVLIGRKDF